MVAVLAGMGMPHVEIAGAAVGPDARQQPDDKREAAPRCRDAAWVAAFMPAGPRSPS